MKAAPPVTEAAWQETVVATMHALGWRHLHVRRSIGKGRHWVTATNVVGWPDIFAWHEGQKRTLAVELKSANGQLSDQQDAVLASLQAAGVECHVWRPADYPKLVRVLRGAPPVVLTPTPPDAPDVESDESFDMEQQQAAHDLAAAGTPGEEG